MINFGGINIDDVRLGGIQVDKVMVGSEQRWPDISEYFHMEVTMASTTKKLKVEAFLPGEFEYSSDGATWIESTTANIDISGSLKWYIRQEQGATLAHISFDGSEFSHVDVLYFGNMANIDRMFVNCKSLISIPSTDFSNVLDFSSLFKNCFKLEYLEDIDTSKGTEFNAMFYGCNNLRCITSINTTNSTFSKDMFKSCGSLSQPDAADRALIQGTPGVVWNNAIPCPINK